MRLQPRKQRGDAYLPEVFQQTSARGRCYALTWSLSTQNSLCVNHKHKTCTLSGKTGFQAHCYCKSSSLPSVLAPLCLSNSFHAACSPLLCDGIPVLWHNPGCTRTRAAMHVLICACASTPHWRWQHRWEANIIHRVVLTCPHLTKRPFFKNSPWGENRFFTSLG